MQDQASLLTDLSDEDLMRLLSNGSVRAFDELYYRYSGKLMSYFTRMLNYDRDQAEDALQDLFSRLAESPEKFDSSRSFKTWVYSVAHNICKNFYRHKKVADRSASDLYSGSGEVDESTFLKLAAKIDSQQFRKMLDEILDSLAPEKKEAFILKYQEDKSLIEIAEIQECPVGSVKSRLHYTLKILEEKLKIFNPVM